MPNDEEDFFATVEKILKIISNSEFQLYLARQKSTKSWAKLGRIGRRYLESKDALSFDGVFGIRDPTRGLLSRICLPQDATKFDGLTETQIHDMTVAALTAKFSLDVPALNEVIQLHHSLRQRTQKWFMRVSCKVLGKPTKEFFKTTIRYFLESTKNEHTSPTTLANCAERVLARCKHLKANIHTKYVSIVRGILYHFALLLFESIILNHTVIFSRLKKSFKKANQKEVMSKAAVVTRLPLTVVTVVIVEEIVKTVIRAVVVPRGTAVVRRTVTSAAVTVVVVLVEVTTYGEPMKFCLF